MTMMAATNEDWNFDFILNIIRQMLFFLHLTLLVEEVVACRYSALVHRKSKLSLLLTMLAFLDASETVLTMDTKGGRRGTRCT